MHEIPAIQFHYILSYVHWKEYHFHFMLKKQIQHGLFNAILFSNGHEGDAWENSAFFSDITVQCFHTIFLTDIKVHGFVACLKHRIAHQELHST